MRLHIIIPTLAISIATAWGADEITLNLRQIDLISTNPQGARIVFAQITASNATTNTAIFFPEGYMAKHLTATGWSDAADSSPCLTDAEMTVLRPHTETVFKVGVWTTNQFMKIGQTFSINPNLQMTEDMIRSAHDFLSNAVWTAPFEIK